MIITGLAVLGAEFGWLNRRVDQLAARVDDLAAGLGVRFDATNAKLDATYTKLDATYTKLDATNAKLEATNAKFDAISQRLGAEFRAEIAAQTSALAKSIAAARSVAPPPWAPVLLAPAPVPGYTLPPPRSPP